MCAPNSPWSGASISAAHQACFSNAVVHDVSHSPHRADGRPSGDDRRCVVQVPLFGNLGRVD
jgi:hypothetical protein